MNEFENEFPQEEAEDQPDSRQETPQPEEEPHLSGFAARFAEFVKENPPESENAEFESESEFESEPSAPPVSAYFPPVNYSPVVPVKPREKMAPGLKVFAIVLAVAIALTAACAAGYAVGSRQPSGSLYSDVDVDLTAKPADTDEMTAAQVYAEVSPSVVGIRVYNEKGEMSDASGVIYTEDGYVVTNDHIYAEIGAPCFKIYLSDGRQYSADYVAGDTISDLAVLKIRDGKDLKPAVLGNSKEAVCGENVVTLGYPTDALSASTVTRGILSQVDRRMRSTTTNYSMHVLQIDAAINAGSSGGALVNMYGQVIGITAFKLNPTGGYEGLGFAIPTVTVKRVVEQLIADGKVTDRPKLGITYNELDSVTAEINGYDAVGLYISTVASDSDLFGKVDEGDIITHINGIEITADEIVLDVLENCKTGDTITLTVLSNGTVTDYKVVLSANVGESSYKKSIEEESSSAPSIGGGNGGSNGTFDFPFGE